MTICAHACILRVFWECSLGDLEVIQRCTEVFSLVQPGVPVMNISSGVHSDTKVAWVNSSFLRVTLKTRFFHFFWHTPKMAKNGHFYDFKFDHFWGEFETPFFGVLRIGDIPNGPSWLRWNHFFDRPWAKKGDHFGTPILGWLSWVTQLSATLQFCKTDIPHDHVISHS